VEEDGSEAFPRDDAASLRPKGVVLLVFFFATVAIPPVTAEILTTYDEVLTWWVVC
jgi:hypothetical protein